MDSAAECRELIVHELYLVPTDRVTVVGVDAEVGETPHPSECREHPFQPVPFVPPDHLEIPSDPVGPELLSVSRQKRSKSVHGDEEPFVPLIEADRHGSMLFAPKRSRRHPMLREVLDV